ncbi:AAA family ATPase [Leptolyngbya sp. 15MV]|nr:AAA family ATPase [Leptolyngbya sp. 15MV]
MPNESRHPGEGAAAGNVTSGTDVPSHIRVDNQEIHAWMALQSPYCHAWMKKPDGPNDGRYFGSDVEGAVEYIVRQNEAGFNAYFTFNIPTGDCGVKPSKAQIVALRGLHVDIDAPKNGEPFDKDAVLAAVRADRPTYVVDSGGGVHAYWLFDQPIEATPDAVAAVEALNRALIAKFNGDHAAANVDRVMRVPGTANWPDAKKRAAGRRASLAKVISADTAGARPSLAQLQAYYAPAIPTAPQSAPQTPAPPSVGDAEVVGRLCRDFALAALYSGDLTAYDGDESRADLALVNAILPRTGYDADQTERIWLNSPLGQRPKVQQRADYRRRTIEEAFNGNGASNRSTPAWPNLLQISADEWQFANATPRVVIEYLIYHDVGTLIAAGGTGKTTFILWLAIHVILGVDFAGRKIAAPGRVVLLTAEDSREMLVARLRSIYFEMFPHGTVPDAERDAKLAAIRDGMVIIDVSDNVQRLTCVERDVVRVDHAAVDALTALIQPLSPSLVVIDPAVSFGVGESRVNDAEQGLIEAARRIRRQNNCAVFYVHHTGKANSRDKAEDQYAGRGGSAFADGSRMVFVLNRLDPKDWQKDTGGALQPGETGLKMTVAKLSYARPQAPIYLVRKGYRFEYVEPVVETDEDRNSEDDEAVFAFLSNGLVKGETFSRHKLESAKLNLSRARLRAAIERLIEAGRVSQREEAGRGLALIPTVAVANGEGA